MSCDEDTRFMRAAIAEAEAAEAAGEVPVGAVVVCAGRVIARAHNLTETLRDATAHAEMQAITAAAGFVGGKYLDECTMYVTIEPCAMCAGAVGLARMKRLVYGADDPKRGFTVCAPLALHPRTDVGKSVLAGECAALMRGFFRARR